MSLLDNFKYFNRVRIANGCLQIVLLITLLLGLQLTLTHCHLRFDFSKKRNHTLHTETKAFLKTLSQPIKIFLLNDGHEEETNFASYFKDLMRTFQEACIGLNTSLSFRSLHSLKMPQEILWLKEKYGFSETEGVLVVLGERNKFLTKEEFFHEEHFVGESTILTTLTQLSNPPKILYWCTGHGELDGKNVHLERGGSSVCQLLQQLNFEVKYIDDCLTLPEDANTLFICGPQLPFLSQECDVIKEFLLKRNGHLFVGLHPIYEHGLNPLLEAVGLYCDGSLLLDESKDFVSTNGNLIVRRFKPNVLTQAIVNKNVGLLFGLTTMLQELKKDDRCEHCAFSSETSWVKHSETFKDLSFNPTRDIRGPHILCSLYTSVKNNNFNLKLPLGKSVFVACADWLDNGHINTLGNKPFFMQICQYLENEIHTPQFTVEMEAPLKIILSQQKFLLLTLNFLILPFIFFIIGLMTSVLRKE